MNTEPQEENSSTESKQEKLGTTVPKSVHIRDKDEPSPQQETANPEQYNEPLAQKPLRWFDGWRVNRELDAVNVVASIIGIAALFLLIYQSCELRRTNEIAEESLRLAKEGFDESRKSGEEEADRAERTLRVTEKLADATTRQADANAQAAEATQATARATEQNSKTATQAFIVGSQAYIGITADIVSFAAEAPFRVHLNFLNEGNSPASIEVRHRLTLNDKPEPPTNKPGFVGSTVFTVLPKREKTSVLISLTLTPAQIQAIQENRLFLFLYSVDGHYTTVGGKRPLRFCFIYANQIGGFADCSDLKKHQIQND